jgi:uncharacterized damage-inducible protein DinB
MGISKSLLPEFDHEMATTRKTLERVPEDKFDWKPHEKSSAMGGLASHISNIPTWAINAINQDSLDLAPGGVPVPPLQGAKSQAELLRTFDDNIARAREAIAGATDEALFSPWSLLHGGKTIMTLPRIAVLRSFVMSHLIHHRGQLSVYLRLNDIPVPAIYGPSADEGGFMDQTKTAGT